MPRKVDSRFVDVDEEQMQRENTMGEDEIANLQAQLEQSQQEAEELARELINIKSGPGGGVSFGIYLLILAVMVGGRLVSYIYIEDFGKSARWIGIGEDLLYGVTAVALISQWLDAGWKAIEWLIIPNCVVVLTAMLGAVAIFSRKLLEGNLNAPAGDPLMASGVAILALLFAASPASQRGLTVLQSFLDHPIDTLKKAGGL